MTTYISVKLRQLVSDRAGNCCEYCLLNQNSIFLAFEIDHIISEKHHGETVADNLCLSCPDCNRHKGSDIGSIDKVTKKITSFYNLRTDNWSDHFRLMADFTIEPLTDVGRVTARILRFNTDDRISDRILYARIGEYPCRD